MAKNSNIVSCHACGTNNRVAAHSFMQVPRCGACRAVLWEPFSIKIYRYLYRRRYFFIVLSGLCVLAVLQSKITWPDLWALVRSEGPSKGSPETCVERQQPHQGTYARHTNLPSQVPLRITTASG